MKSIYKIYLTGVGGQGIVRASTIIGEAAMKKGLKVVMSELHGMAERGGMVTTEVLIGGASSAIIQNGDADLLFAMEPVEALRSLEKVGPNTTAIVNSTPIIPFTVSLGIDTYPEISQIIAALQGKIKNLFILDALNLAQQAGDTIASNIVMLGAAAAIPGFPVEKELLLASIKGTFPASTIEVNSAAFKMGYEAIQSEMSRGWKLANETRIESLDAFFNPQTIAIIGVSRDPNKVGSVILSNALQNRMGIRIYPVNPRIDEVMGLKCYPSIIDIPEKIDLAIISLPANFVLETIKECIKKETKAAIIVSAGFGETESGKELEIELKKTIKQSKMRVLGPNTLGVLLPGKLNTFFLPYDESTTPPAGHIAFATQSGAMGHLMLERMAFYGVGTSVFIPVGNKIDVDENDLVEYLANDAKTKCIACYLESFAQGKKFFEICKRVSLEKPIVVLKAGSTKWGARAAASHTGALAGSNLVVEGALKQAGAVRAQNEEELWDFANILASGKALQGNGIAIITSAGGMGVTATDCLERTPNLEMAELSKSTREKIKAKIPPFASAANPIDLTATSTPEMIDAVLEELQKDDNVDGILLFSIPQPPLPVTEEQIQVVIKWVRQGKPLVVGTIENRLTAEAIRKYALAGVPVFPSIERAIKALQVLAERGEYLKSCQEGEK